MKSNNLVEMSKNNSCALVGVGEQSKPRLVETEDGAASLLTAESRAKVRKPITRSFCLSMDASHGNRRSIYIL